MKAIYLTFWFSEKNYISYLLVQTRTCAYQGIKYVGFTEKVFLNILGFTKNLVYIVNEWSLAYGEIIISHTVETYLEQKWLEDFSR